MWYPSATVCAADRDRSLLGGEDSIAKDPIPVVSSVRTVGTLDKDHRFSMPDGFL